MKRNIFIALALFCAVACTKEKNPYEPVGGDPIRIDASADEVVLTENENAKTAVTFSWTPGFEYTEAVSVTYCFKIDVADNNFETATELEVLGPDVFEKSFTVEELNDLCLEQWDITPGESVMLEAKVIGRLTADKFIMPQVATTTCLVTTYRLPSSPLYILGDALTANGRSWEPSAAIQMTEEILSRQYSYKGEFAKGEYIFPKSRNAILPAWFQGTDPYSMEFHEEEEGARFQITRAAVYKIVANIKSRTLNLIYYPEYEHVYMIGAASPGGWKLSEAYDLTWIEGTAKFVYEGYMKAGDFKFAAGARDWNAPFFMAPTENQDNLSIGSMQLVQPGGVDYKWVITEANAGNWRITLDIDALTIKFEKI